MGRSRSRSHERTSRRNRRSRSRDRRDRSRSPRRKRSHSRSPRRDRRRQNRDRSKSADRHHRHDHKLTSRTRDRRERTSSVSADGGPAAYATPMENESEALQQLFGFSSFSTTKGQKVAGNESGASMVHKKRKYRQYMNRRGGFNRPLDPIT